jgi:hypothetical protein
LEQSFVFFVLFFVQAKNNENVVLNESMKSTKLKESNQARSTNGHRAEKMRIKK